MKTAYRVIMLTGLVACVGCGASSVTPSRSPTQPAMEETAADRTSNATTWPPLPVADTPYLNTTADVQYVGSAACIRCHAEANETYHHTAMSVSMLPVDLDTEPPDGTFDHPLSGRRYAVVRRDGALWHIESKLADGEPLVIAEYPVKYVVGSGRHSRTYLVETEGFLVESPITWYSERKRWDMSPGYDRANHLGFERAAGQGCLECHAGRSAALGRSLHRMEVHESAIGCERCHGPGSLHLNKHRNTDITAIVRSKTEIDETIVNPAKLSRELSEAICQQCHLRSHASIVARGRDLSDFRPGLPLSQFRNDYRLEAPDTPLTVVSHVEQLHLSRCYANSQTITCLTCHDPHAAKDVERGPPHYNAVCATCHAVDACGAPQSDRERTTLANNCVHCHMPQGETEIPHLAFTHHRIGQHALTEPRTKDAEMLPRGLGELRPFHDLSAFSSEERQRSLALAYAEFAYRDEEADHAEVYQRRAWVLLIELHNAGLRDATMEAVLARLAFQLDPSRAEEFATAALADETLSGQDRCNALFLLGDAAIERRKEPAALPFVIELTKLRRHPLDWLVRAQAERAAGRDPIPSLEAAVRIGSNLPRIHQRLAEHYMQSGDQARAARHARLSQP